MSGSDTMKRIKTAVVAIIRESRGLTFLSPYEVNIDKLSKKNNHYEISGSFTYIGFLGYPIEKGKFKIVLDENLNPVSVEITSEKG